MAFVCPVCGYPNLEEEPHGKETGASYEICPSCFFQFGFDDDDKGITYEEWRMRWVNEGMPWRSRGRASPTSWDPRSQLNNLTKGESE
jgi:hypothetical protein